MPCMVRISPAMLCGLMSLDRQVAMKMVVNSSDIAIKPRSVGNGPKIDSQCPRQGSSCNIRMVCGKAGATISASRLWQASQIGDADFRVVVHHAVETGRYRGGGLDADVEGMAGHGVTFRNSCERKLESGPLAAAAGQAILRFGETGGPTRWAGWRSPGMHGVPT